MYNMDNNVMYKTLVYSDVADASGLMVTSKYLKSPIIKADSGCYLRNYGDLSETGIIYCDYHGCVDSDDRNGLRKASGYTSKTRTAAGGKSNGMIAVMVVLGIFSVGVMIVLHNVLPKKQTHNPAKSCYQLRFLRVMVIQLTPSRPRLSGS